MEEKDHQMKRLTQEHKNNISLGNKGKIFSQERRANISRALTGKKLSEEHRLKLRNAKLGKVLTQEHKIKLSEASRRNIKNGKWKNQYGGYQGGVKWRGIHSLNNPRYRNWRMSVFTRDEFTCKMKDDECCGGLQAHHLLRWRDYVELRYNTNNGITLCRFHHPRKMEDEKKLLPIFRKLVAEKSYISGVNRLINSNAQEDGDSIEDLKTSLTNATLSDSEIEGGSMDGEDNAE